MKLFSPADGAVLPLMSDQQKYFRAHTDTLAPDENMDWRNLTKHDNADCSLPEKVRFCWEDTGEERWVLSVSRSPDMADAAVFEVTEPEYLWENGEIGAVYYWKVNDSPVRSFATEALPPRWIRVDGITNVRDAGGWKTESGKTIRQGLLYRGSEMDIHVTITDEGIRTMREELGIRTDLDLRGEVVGKRFDSPLGADVQYCLLPIKAYDQLMKDPANLREVFALLADRDNYPVYYHCWGGADRTGSLAFLLGGLLGVPEGDLLVDYELTSLAIWGNRTRTRADFSEFMELLAGYGGTTAARSENFLLSLGVTAAEIAAIRELFLGE